jgi:hypothetical protein
MKRIVLSILGLLLGLAVYYYVLPQEGRHPDVGAPSHAPEPASAPAPAPSLDREWSDTDPAVNLEHVFEGQINRRGKPIGFHSRPGGSNPGGARLVRRVSGPNPAGVYIAEVEIRNGSGRWLRKTSTFYPDRLSRDEVVAAILHAWNGRRNLGDGKFQGDSGKGFTIEGYTLDDGGINTAYPLYKR